MNAMANFMESMILSDLLLPCDTLYAYITGTEEFIKDQLLKIGRQLDHWIKLKLLTPEEAIAKYIDPLCKRYTESEDYVTSRIVESIDSLDYDFETDKIVRRRTL